MAIFCGRDFDVGILVDHSVAHIVTKEHFRYRHRGASVRDPDFGTNVEELYDRLDEGFGWWRAVHIDRPSARLVPSGRHQHAETAGVIVVMVCNENCTDIAQIDARRCKAARNAVACIDDIVRGINDQQIG